MELFRSEFLIRPEDYRTAAVSLIKSGLAEPKDGDAESVCRKAITDALRRSGLFFAFADSGCEVLDCEDDMADDTVDFMEQVFKAISKSVEPGRYIEFWNGDSLVRYDFLYDTVERCTVPHILYTKREAI